MKNYLYLGLWVFKGFWPSFGSFIMYCAQKLTQQVTFWNLQNGDLSTETDNKGERYYIKLL